MPAVGLAGARLAAGACGRLARAAAGGRAPPPPPRALPPRAGAPRGLTGGGPQAAYENFSPKEPKKKIPPEFGDLFREGRPRALALGRPSVEEAVCERGPWLYGAALRAFGFFSRESALVRGARGLLEASTARGTAPELFEQLGLERNFRSLHAMTGLHVWMLLVRLRRRGDEAARVSQDLYLQFQRATELRVYEEGVRVRISKWLKELEKIFLGQCLALDKAVEGDQGDLEEALWKNIFAGEGDRRAAAALARYVRRELASLEMTELETVLNGDLAFRDQD